MADKKTATQMVIDGKLNFGALENYTAGGGLAPGKYALKFGFVLRTPKDKQGNIKGETHLAVRALCYALDSPGEEPREQFWGMGKKMHESWLPNPENELELVQVPNGPPTVLYNSTNWSIALKSMYEAGLPVGILSTSLEPIDGAWVLTGEIPEPEDRKTMGTGATSEVAQERKLGKIPVIIDFVEGGKPWEGGGGIPDPSTKPAPKKAGAKGGKPAPKVVEPVEEEQQGDEEDIEAQAINTLADILGDNLKGMPRLRLRVEAIKAATKKYDESVATQIVDTFFSSDKELNIVLGKLGFKLVGTEVKPQS